MHGLASVKPNSGWLRLGAFHDIDSNKRFSWGAGVDLAVALRNTSVFVPHQIYGEVKYRCLNLLVGQKVIPDPIVNSDLSSGPSSIPVMPVLFPWCVSAFSIMPISGAARVGLL